MTDFNESLELLTALRKEPIAPKPVVPAPSRLDESYELLSALRSEKAKSPEPVRPMAGVQDQSLRHPPTPTADLPRGEPAPVAAQPAAPVPQPTPAPQTAPIPAPEPVPGEEPMLTAEQIAQTMPLPGISPVFGEVKPGEEFARQARGYPRLDTSTLPTYTPPPERKTIIEGMTHGLSQAGLGMNRGAAGLAKLVGENVLAMSKAMGFEDSKGARQLVDWGNQVNDWVKRYQAEHPEEQMALKPGENYLYSIGESIAKPENLVQGLVQTIPLILGGIVAGKVGGAVAGTIGAGGKAIPYAARVLGLGSQVAGETYADARAAGTDVPGATVQAILTGLGEGAIEEFTLGRKIDIFKGATGQLIKGAAEKTLVETMARSFLRGTAEEATQGINQRFWNWVFTDRSQDVLAGVGQEAALGGLLESVMSGGAVVGGKAYGQMISPQQQVQIIDDLDAVLEQSPNLNPAQKAEIKQELGRVRDAAEKGEFKEPQPLVPPEAQAGAGPTALEEARAAAQPGAVPLTPEGKVETKVEDAATEVAPAPGTRVQETAAPAPVAPVPGAVVPEKGAERVAPAPVTGQPATGEEAKPTYGEIISSAERADIERQLKAAPLGKRGIEVSKLRQEGETADQFATKLSRYFIRAAEENDLPAATKGLADLPALDNSIDYEIQAKFKSPKIKPAAPLKIAESHAATDNTRYILGGVYLDAKKGMYVSTDGRRLLMLPAKETIQGESRTVAIRDMKDLGKKAGETIDGRFPNWEQVIPKYNKSDSVTLPIEPEAVIPNLMAAAQLSKKLGKTKMVMAHIAGEGFSVTINPQFALDAIRALAQSGGSRITVTMAADPQNAWPVVFEADNGAKAIVMPMKSGDGFYNKGQPRGLRTVIAAVKGEPSTTLTPAVAQPGASQGAVQAAPPAPAPEGEKAGEVAPAKEPWQMTRERAVWGEFKPDGASTDRALAGRLARWEKIKRESNSQNVNIEAVEKAIASEKARIERANAHRSAVAAALASGKPVPPEVLKDYPELAKKTKSATPEGMRRRPITEKDEVSFSGQLSKLIEKARAKGEHRYIFPTAYGLRMEFKPPPGKLQYYEIFPDGSIDYVDRVPPVFGSATQSVAAPDALAAEKAALQKQASTLTGAAKIQREYRKLTGEKQAPLNDAIAHIARVRAVEKLGIAPATASAGAAVPPAKPPAAPPAAVPAPEGPSAPGERPSAKGELTGAEALAAIPETIKNAAGETVKLAEVFADIVGKAKDPTGTLSEEVAKVVVGKLNDPRFLANPGQYISTVAANTAKDLSAKTAERQAATTGGKALEEEMGRQEAGAAEAIRAGAEEKVTLNQQRQKTIEDAMPKMKGNPLVRITAAAFHKALAGDLTGKSLIKEVRNAVTEIARDGYKPLGIRGGYSKTILDDAFRKAYDRVSKVLREQATLSVMPRTTPGENKVADMVAKNIREVTDYNARKEESGALTLPTAKIFEKRTWSDIQNTAMRKMLDVSRTPMDLAGAVKAYAIDRIKRLREALVFYPRLREFPVYRNDLRKFMDAPTDAINQADIALFGIVGKLKHDRAGYNTFRHIVALEDLIGDAELGKPIPGGFDIAALKKELEYQQSIASPEVKEATEKHFALMKAVADDLVAREKMKPEDVKEKYFHHAVMDYQTPWGDFIGLPRRIKPPMRKYVSERKGTERMLDMDYIGVTRSHLGQVFLDNAMDDWIEKQGKSNSLESTMTPDQWKAFKQEHPPTPNGIVDVEGKRYRWFQFQPGNTFQEGKAVSQKLLADAIEANMTAAELAEMRGPQGGKAIRDALIMGGKHKMFLVPEAVYDSFKSLRQPAGDMYDIVREVIRGTALWKRMVIDLGGLPIRIPNMLSDFMKLYIHDPKAYLNVPAATKMIFKRHPAAQRAFGTELNNYEKRIQDIAHQQNVDMASVYREMSYVLNEDALYNMRHPYMRFNPLRYLAGAWEGIVMDTESIPRYAKLMTDMNRILAGQSVHASTLDGVKELAEKGFNVEAAGRAARLVTVDYREVSPTYSRWGRGLLFPFVTWFDYTARDITTNIQKTKGVGLAKVLIPYALAFMWNNTGDRRETEENLPPYLKYMFHINTGYRDKDGKAIVISMMTPYDAWGRWFGLDRIGEKITNVRAGRMTTADAVKEQALDFVKGPGRNLRSLLHPMIQTIYGLVSNKHPMFGTPIVPEDAGPDKQNKLRAQFVASAFLTPYSQLLRVSRDFEPGDAWSKFLFEGGPMDYEKAFGFRHVDTEKERQKMISAEVEQNVEPALKNIKDKVQDGFIKWQGTGDKADYEAAIKYMQGMREKGYSVPNDMFLGWIQSYRVALGVTKEKLRLAKPGSAEEKALRGDIRMLEQSAWAERLQGRSRAILPVVKDVVESYYKLGPEKLKSPESE